MHRRFGRGAARLPLGIPVEAGSLARAALEPAAGERFVSLAPAVGLVVIVGLIGGLASVLTGPGLSLAPPTRIVADAWEIPPDPIIAPTPIAEVTPPPKSLPEVTPVPIVEPAAPAPTPFDPRTLAATSAPRVPELDATSSSAMASVARPGGRPTARPLSDLALTVPRSPRTGNARFDEFDANAPSFDRSFSDAARPNAAVRRATTATPAWDAMNERRDFLAELEAESRSGPPAVPVERALPAVAAPTRAAAEAVRKAALEQLQAEGWEAVPLADLPDCRPAGRQDVLKRQIMRAAAGRPSCTHDAGAYRFLETRNLNAFLMGARNHDTTTQARSGPRNACEVLERALRCLEGTPSKEIGTR